MNLIFLFTTCYVFLDWLYDTSPLRWAKLVLAIISTPPAFFTLVELITMKYLVFRYLLTLTIENLTYGFFSKNFKEYDNIKYILSMINEKNKLNISDYLNNQVDIHGNKIKIEIFEKIRICILYYLFYFFGGCFNGIYDIRKHQNIFINNIINNPINISNELYNNFNNKYENLIKDNIYITIYKKISSILVVFKYDNTQEYYNTTNNWDTIVYLGYKKVEESNKIVNNNTNYFKSILHKMNNQNILYSFEELYCLSDIETETHLHDMKFEENTIIVENCKCKIKESEDNFLLNESFLNLIKVSENKEKYFKDVLIS